MKMKIHILVILSILLLTVVTSRRRVKREEGHGDKPAQGDNKAETVPQTPEDALHHNIQTAINDYLTLKKQGGKVKDEAKKVVKDSLDKAKEDFEGFYEGLYKKLEGSIGEGIHFIAGLIPHGDKDKKPAEKENGKPAGTKTGRVKRRHFRN